MGILSKATMDGVICADLSGALNVPGSIAKRFANRKVEQEFDIAVTPV
jgi:hypothetical protein